MNVDIFALLNFRAASLCVVLSRVQIFAHLAVNSIQTITIYFFPHIIFSRILYPARNARIYVLRENVYVYSIVFRLLYCLFLHRTSEGRLTIRLSYLPLSYVVNDIGTKVPAQIGQVSLWLSGLRHRLV